MRRKYFLVAPAVGAAALAGLFALKPKTSDAAPKNEAAAAQSAQTLPIKNVVLFSSGVGYFQRQAEIEGNARVDLTFQVRDINDLIKSMVIQDEKGVVSAVSYDSLDPVDRTLKSYAVNLTNNPTFGQILTQMRGEKAEVVLNQTAANQPGTVTGSIMGVEKKRETTKEGVVESEQLNMWCAEGVRGAQAERNPTVAFSESDDRKRISPALETLAQSHDAQKKAVSLNFTGEGKRDVKVGYVVENPIWKTSYRLVLDKDGKPFLQGWAVVDNPTDDDWNSVGMALISGRPISVPDGFVPAALRAAANGGIGTVPVAATGRVSIAASRMAGGANLAFTAPATPPRRRPRLGYGGSGRRWAGPAAAARHRWTHPTVATPSQIWRATRQATARAHEPRPGRPIRRHRVANWAISSSTSSTRRSICRARNRPCSRSSTRTSRPSDSRFTIRACTPSSRCSV